METHQKIGGDLSSSLISTKLLREAKRKTMRSRLLHCLTLQEKTPLRSSIHFSLPKRKSWRKCIPRKNVVFERHQFWQITQKDSETVDQFVIRLKHKVKSCEYSSPVDDMVRDKFVFSIRDLQVKEQLLREV